MNMKYTWLVLQHRFKRDQSLRLKSKLTVRNISCTQLILQMLLCHYWGIRKISLSEDPFLNKCHYYVCCHYLNDQQYTEIINLDWGPLHDQSYSKADQAKIAEKHTWDAVYRFGPDPVLREYNKDPSDWYAQLEKFKVKFTPKTTLKKLYTNLQERYLHLYRKDYQTYSAKLTKT